MHFTPTILCVDDDEDDLFFIKEAIGMQSFPFNIRQAKNGAEALAELERGRLRDELPCLIIMDMNMPRMDGKQALLRIRQQPELMRIPVVIFTTSSNIQDRNYFEAQGIRFITKPFDYRNFTHQIVDLLAFCAELEG